MMLTVQTAIKTAILDGGGVSPNFLMLAIKNLKDNNTNALWRPEETGRT